MGVCVVFCSRLNHVPLLPPVETLRSGTVSLDSAYQSRLYGHSPVRAAIHVSVRMLVCLLNLSNEMYFLKEFANSTTQASPGSMDMASYTACALSEQRCGYVGRSISKYNI
jgi:hypothetical protein